MKKKEIPLSVQILYGIGVSYAIVDQIFAQWVLTYYFPTQKFITQGMRPLLPPILLSLAFVFSRLIDMFSDPIVGYISDKSNSKWGRRIPFIAIGAIPLTLATVAFFYPVKSGNGSTFLYLSLVGAIFFIFYTIVGAPYNALIPELSSTTKDRVNLSTWQSIFRLVYVAIAMILPGILIKILGGGNPEKGIRIMVILLSIIATIGLYIPVIFVNEKKYSGGKTSNKSFKESLKSVFSNKSFIVYLLGFMFFFVGFNTLRACTNYYVTDIMGYGGKAITLASALLFGVSLLLFFPVNFLSRKFGYKNLMLISLFLLVLFSAGLFLLGKVFPAGMGFLFFALMGIPVSGAAFILPAAMLSEISAVTTEKTGTRIEGVFFGIQGFFLKLAFLISISAVPVLLVMGSGVPFLKSLIRKPEKPEIFGIYMTIIFSIVALIVSFMFYFFYREEKAKGKSANENT